MKKSNTSVAENQPGAFDLLADFARRKGIATNHSTTNEQALFASIKKTSSTSTVSMSVPASVLTTAAANQPIEWNYDVWLSAYYDALDAEDSDQQDALARRAEQAMEDAQQRGDTERVHSIGAAATKATHARDEAQQQTEGEAQPSPVPNVEVPFGTSTTNLPLAPASTGQQVASTEKSNPPAASAPGKMNIDRESRETLKYISEDFVMLASGTKLVAYHIATGDELGKDGFRKYCAKHYGRIVATTPPDRDGKVVEKEMPAGEIWWDWDDAEQRVVRRIVMEPTSKSEVDDNPEVFNRWHILKHTMAVPDGRSAPTDIKILTDHLMYLSGSDVVGVTYFLCWLAQLYQTPEIKMPTAVLMYSKYTRIGKNLMQKLLTKVFGKPMVSGEPGSKLQKGGFDDAIEHRRLFFINELKRAEKADWYETFKSMVSEEDMQFEGKGRASKEIRNITHFVITTNHEDALPLMENDGRICVLRCLEPRKDDAYYDELVAWIDGPGAPALAQILDTWKFPAGWKPHAPVPQTAATKAMQKSAKGELHSVVTDMIDAGEAPFEKDIIIVADACNVLNNSGRALTKPANETTLGAVLKDKYGEPLFRRILCADGVVRMKRYYVIRNAPKWDIATSEQKGEHLNTGARLFAVQSPDDCPKTEVSDHE